MDYLQRIEQGLKQLTSPTKEELRGALISLNTTMHDLKPFLQMDPYKPYYRKLLFQNDEVELLLMNWSDLSCAPHDHGHSSGWIQIMTGSTINTVYRVDKGELPEAYFSRLEQHGTIFFAPKYGVHKMRAKEETLVTLHLYSPPIKDMIVYDLKKCAACMVSDQCGAWWPEEQREKVKEWRLDQ
ncbi:cysteine dioxygenase family protein [Alkalihalobacillus sp. FSL R5-0424]